MIAVWSPRVARCRSRQDTEAFSVPSSNHLIDTSPVKDVFLIFVGVFIHATRFISARQNASGSRSAASYSERYWSAFTCAEAAKAGRTGKTCPVVGLLSAMGVLPFDVAPDL